MQAQIPVEQPPQCTGGRPGVCVFAGKGCTYTYGGLLRYGASPTCGAQHGRRSTRGRAPRYLVAPPDRLAARLVLEDHAPGGELVANPIRLRPVLRLACGAACLDVLLDLGVADG